MQGPTCIAWANLTPFLLQALKACYLGGAGSAAVMDTVLSLTVALAAHAEPGADPSSPPRPLGPGPGSRSIGLLRALRSRFPRPRTEGRAGRTGANPVSQLAGSGDSRGSPFPSKTV